MPIPFMPVNLFKRPFAVDGDHVIIPDTKPISGRASLTEGFPTETQLPLTQGGIAPNRLDFNGMFNMLSAFSFWQQSGGLFNYITTINYTSPAIVVRNNMIWWCLKENGPESANGLQTPGNAPDYWQDLFTKILNDFAESGGSSDPAAAIGGNPVGAYIHYHGTTAPDGYLHCNGSTFSATHYPKLYQVLGSAILPDLRGKFIRGLGGNSLGLGVTQGDDFKSHSHTVAMYGQVFHTYGAPTNYGDDDPIVGGLQSGATGGQETRPINMAALICIRHD